MSLDIKFFPLTFINSNEEILKQLRNTVIFSYLTERYEETTLDHYLESTQYGYTASALEKGKHRLLRITDITNSKVDWNSVPFCDCNSEEKYLLKENDILVARTGGTTGKSFIVRNPPSNGVFASYLIRIRLKTDVELSFIERFLNSYVFWTQIVEMKSGTAMPNVNAEKLKTLKLPKCDLSAQKEISSLLIDLGKPRHLEALFNKLDSIEMLFANNTKLSTELTHQLDLVKQLRQAFLREAMQGKLVPQDPNDEPASELFKKIKAEKEELIKEKKIKKEKELPPIKPEEIPFEIPKNWVWCRLGEIMRISSGNGLTAAQMAKDGTTPVYGGNGINGHHNKWNVNKRTITIGRVGYYCGSIHLTEEKAWVTDNAFIVSYSESNIFREFLIQLLKWGDLGKQQYAGSQPVISGQRVYPKLLPLPPLSEQQRIVAKLEQLMRHCDELEQSIKQSQTQNEQLLQQVLREALRPNKEFKMKDEFNLAAEG